MRVIKKAYYARSMQIYGTDKEISQLKYLGRLYDIVDPVKFSEDKFMDKVAVFECGECGKKRYYPYRSDRREVDCENCEVVMIRKCVVLKYLLGILICGILVFTDNDGFISRGVYNEIIFAKENNINTMWLRDGVFENDWDLRFCDVKDWKYKYAIIKEV